MPPYSLTSLPPPQLTGNTSTNHLSYQTYQRKSAPRTQHEHHEERTPKTLALQDELQTPYPTSETVPFPLKYNKPYQVQADLMNTLLTALKPPESSDKPTPFTRRKKLILLESPTGTGKSLSLACSCIAWLNYMEGYDMRDLNKEKKEETINKCSRTSDSHSTADDWINSWVAGSTTNTYDNKSSNTSDPSSTCSQKCHGSALTHRQKLTAKLAQINQTIINRGCTRDELLRVSLNKLRLEEKRSLARQGKLRKKVGIQLNTLRKKEEDFCAEDYYSDDERLAGDFDSDDSSDEENATLSSLTATKAAKERNSSHDYETIGNLINGSNLDGSSATLQINDSKTNLKNNTSSNRTASKADTVGNVEPGNGVRKIIFASRTHSQLSQFVKEIRQIPVTTPIRVVALGGRRLLCGNAKVNNGKRNESAISEACLDLQKGTTDIASDVTEVHIRKRKRKVKAKDTQKCPLRSSKASITGLALHTLAQPTDIEDLAKFGEVTSTCAYYASRQSLPAAQVVVLPYNTLLSKSCRDSVGLSLKNNLVIMDEAHNVPEAIRSLKATCLSLPVMVKARESLEMYYARYKNRLAGRNVFYVLQIQKCLLAMERYLSMPPSTTTATNSQSPSKKHNQYSATNRSKEEAEPASIVMSSNELLFALQLDTVNFFKMDRYLTKSRLPQKLLGFTNFVESAKHNEHTVTTPKSAVNEASGRVLSKHTSTMSIVQSFFSCFNSNHHAGRMIVEWPSSSNSNGGQSTTAECHPTLRYALLNPAEPFQDILTDAYAVVMAGGTMRPFSHMAAELLLTSGSISKTYNTFNGNNSDQTAAMELITAVQEASIADMQLSQTSNVKQSQQISFASASSITHQTKILTTFSCGHVIPPSHIYTTCLSRGPTNIPLNFRAQNRTSISTNHKTNTADSLADELGCILRNLCNIVPAGLIVFVPSYAYETQLVHRWETTRLLSQLQAKKTFHREPRDSKLVEKALELYAIDATRTKQTKNTVNIAGPQSRRKGGAILLCVIGGKMSEGINFADDMARCVLVAGLPYPDCRNVELREKMALLDTTKRVLDQRIATTSNNLRVGGTNISSTISGRSYYRNLCMRAVNQSIGRAIRHENDYAAVILADERYETDDKVWDGLPSWLKNDQRQPQTQGNFGKFLFGLRTFYKSKEK